MLPDPEVPGGLTIGGIVMPSLLNGSPVECRGAETPRTPSSQDQAWAIRPLAEAGTA